MTDDADADPDGEDFDLEAALERSRVRVAKRVPKESPLFDNGDLLCPWCRTPMAVRFSTLGRAGADPITGEPEGDRTPYIDGVGFKCAGDGCGFRPDFDIPLREGAGYWPQLTAREEFEREIGLRGGNDNRRLDAAYDASDEDLYSVVEERLCELGYLDR